MGMTAYLESQLINHIFRGTAYSMPANIYIALLTVAAVSTDTGATISNGTGTGVEVSTSGTGYTRQLLSPSTSNWAAAASGTTSNVPIIAFPQATGSWGTIVGVAICDAIVGGNLLFLGTLTASKLVNAGDTFQFSANQLQVQLN